jgi:8-oxo-dGTP pyrophosphatase MutT (NUDIX family)
MDRLQHFTEKLQAQLSKPLPGKKAQFRMAPYERILQAAAFKLIKQPVKSAVLVLFYEKEDRIHLVLILRKKYLGVHSAQVSFPGGKQDPEDQDLEHTALRETEEEVGVKKEDIHIIGPLTDLYIPPSNYLVQPYVGYLKQAPVFKPEPKEVEEVIEAPLTMLMDDAIIGKKKIKVSARNLKIKYPYFDVKGHTVWGATAMMLSELKEVLQKGGLA